MKKYLLAAAVVVVTLGFTNGNGMEGPDLFTKEEVPELTPRHSALTEKLRRLQESQQLESFQAILEKKLKRAETEDKKARLRTAFDKAIISFKELSRELRILESFNILFDFHYRGVFSPVSES